MHYTLTESGEDRMNDLVKLQVAMTPSEKYRALRFLNFGFWLFIGGLSRV